MVPISHREGDYIATAGAPTDALQEVIPITVTHSDEVVFETTWSPGPRATASDLDTALVEAVAYARAATVSFDIEEVLVDVADRHRHPSTPDPLHVRARVAIKRLGLDGHDLEVAVSVFGWGSDEANGSLLGTVCEARNDQGVFCRSRPGITKSGAPWACYTDDGGIYGGASRTEALVVALEASQP